jgi:hypothetical protein
MPKIIAILEKLVGTVFKVFDMVTQLGVRLWSILGRVYDFFVMLDRATDGWSTVILGVIAAWKLLNLSFLATPLGMLIAGFTALLVLWDDFKTFKEGGQSLINWGSEMTRVIVGLTAAIGTLVGLVYAWSTATKVLATAQSVWSTIQKVINAELGIMAAIEAVIAAPIWVIVAAVSALVAALTLADAKWKIFGGNLSGFVGGVGGKVMDWIGGSTKAPLGTNTSTSNTNINAKMQTDIHVQGSPNSDATARATAAQQTGVNRDFVRNLKGATR